MVVSVSDESVEYILLEWALAFLFDMAFLDDIEKDCSLYFQKINMSPSSSANLLL